MEVRASTTLRHHYRPGLASLVCDVAPSPPEYPQRLFMSEVELTEGALGKDSSKWRCRYKQIVRIGTLHYRFGFTDPAEIKAIQGMAKRVDHL